MDQITEKMNNIDLDKDQKDLDQELKKLKIEEHPEYKIPLRKKCYTAFYSRLPDYISEIHNIKFNNPIKIAKNIEKSCYNNGVMNNKKTKVQYSICVEVLSRYPEDKEPL